MELVGWLALRVSSARVELVWCPVRPASPSVTAFVWTSKAIKTTVVLVEPLVQVGGPVWLGRVLALLDRQTVQVFV